MAGASFCVVGCAKEVPVVQEWRDTTTEKNVILQIRNDTLNFQLNGLNFAPGVSGKVDRIVTKEGRYLLTSSENNALQYVFIVDKGVKTGKIGEMPVKRIN